MLQFEVLKSRSRAGDIQLRLNDLDKAMESARRAIPGPTKLHDDVPADNEYADLLGQLHGTLGSALQRRRQFATAEDSHRKSLALRTALANAFPRDERYQISLARERFALGECLADREKLAEARTLIPLCLAALCSTLWTNPNSLTRWSNGQTTLSIRP